MGETSTTLDYAAEPRSRWRHYRWRMALAMLLIIVIGSGWWFRKPIALRATQLYWSRQCARFTAPADTLRVATKSQDIARFQHDLNYASAVTPGSVSSNPRALGFQPRCWREFAPSVGVLPYAPFTASTTFLHELRTPSGKRRIVHVQCMLDNLLVLPRMMCVIVIEPPTLLSAPRIISRPGAFNFSGRSVPARVYVGQPDPADPTHFTIGFESADRDDNGRPKRAGVIDGYLGDNDVVSFKFRDPASTRGL
jgi:hypothetical protein